MKIVAINGSPRGMQGNTGRLLEEVLAGVREAGGDVEIVTLKGLNVQVCTGCDACHKTGLCPIKDDYPEIRDKLLACDAFIFASPNYIFSITAQLKALFDRCNGLIHCMALEGKYAAVVETSGGGEDQEVLTYMKRFVNCIGARSVGEIGSAMAGNRTFPDEENLFATARGLGRELCRCVTSRQRFPEQDAFISAFSTRMAGLVDYMNEYWLFEKEYWQNKRSPQ